MIKYEVPDSYKKYEQLILSTLKTANEISFEEGQTLPWDSKIGGCPYLLSKDDYPLDSENNPYMFVVQINLAEMPALKNFPTKGLLQFYIKNDGDLGLDCEDGFAIRYIENFEKDEAKLLSKNPYEEETEEFRFYENECKISFTQMEMPLSAESYEFYDVYSDIDFDEDNDEIMEDIYDAFSGAGCRIGGYPGFTQDDPREDDHYDTLLLQLDVDDDADIMIGDSGIMNFFINKEDLIKRDFSKAFFTWDCC